MSICTNWHASRLGLMVVFPRKTNPGRIPMNPNCDNCLDRKNGVAEVLAMAMAVIHRAGVKFIQAGTSRIPVKAGKPV